MPTQLKNFEQLMKMQGEEVAAHDDPGAARNNCSEANSSATRIFNTSFSTSSREAAPIAVPSVFLR